MISMWSSQFIFRVSQARICVADCNRLFSIYLDFFHALFNALVCVLPCIYQSSSTVGFLLILLKFQQGNGQPVYLAVSCNVLLLHVQANKT